MTKDHLGGWIEHTKWNLREEEDQTFIFSNETQFKLCCSDENPTIRHIKEWKFFFHTILTLPVNFFLAK